jgi:hypothetical protein
MKEIDKSVGYGLYHNRIAVIQENGDKYFVDLYLDEILHKTVDVSDKAFRYAEDTAENWTTGIIKE